MGQELFLCTLRFSLYLFSSPLRTGRLLQIMSAPYPDFSRSIHGCYFSTKIIPWLKWLFSCCSVPRVFAGSDPAPYKAVVYQLKQPTCSCGRTFILTNILVCLFLIQLIIFEFWCDQNCSQYECLGRAAFH